MHPPHPYLITLSEQRVEENKLESRARSVMLASGMLASTTAGGGPHAKGRGEEPKGGPVGGSMHEILAEGARIRQQQLAAKEKAAAAAQGQDGEGKKKVKKDKKVCAQRYRAGEVGRRQKAQGMRKRACECQHGMEEYSVKISVQSHTSGAEFGVLNARENGAWPTVSH
eukprot:1133646-Pelagomonas_calceolata.AAC.11